MLPKQNRISRVLFNTLLQSRVVFHSPNLSFRVARAQNNPSKFSFVASKKVSKSAAARNLLRRRGYALVRNIAGRNLNAQTKNNILGAFFLKKGAEKLNPQELQSEIAHLLEKAGIL